MGFHIVQAKLELLIFLLHLPSAEIIGVQYQTQPPCSRAQQHLSIYI